MNNEFAWRKQMRELDGPVEPMRDLWPLIQPRIAVTDGRRRWSRAGLAIAAAALIACAVGLIEPRMQTATTQQAQVVAPSRSTSAGDTASERTALDWARPANRTLASAAEDLDSASADLQQALEQRPDAVFLVGLLNRTNGQRMHLLRTPVAG